MTYENIKKNTYENSKMINSLIEIYGDKIDTLYIFEGHKANRFVKSLCPNVYLQIKLNPSLHAYDLDKSCVSINSIFYRGKHYVFVVYNVDTFSWKEKFPFREGMSKILNILSSKNII